MVLWSIALVAAFFLMTGWIALSDLLQERAALIEASKSNEERTQEILNQTAILKRGAGTTELYRLVAASLEVNLLIDQRMFSWTGFLNQIEATLPNDVMLTSVRPDVIDGTVGAQVGIVSQSVDAIGQFIERLEGTGAFTDVLSREEEVTDDGLYRAVLYGQYVPIPSEAFDGEALEGVTQ